MQQNIKNWWDRIAPKIKYLFFIYFLFLTWLLLRKSGGENYVEILGINLKAIYNDKVAHSSAFLLLTFFAIISFPKIRPIKFVVIFAIYGAIIEILQKNMNLGRTFEYFDILADFTGSVLGFVSAICFKSIMKKKHN